MRKTQWFLALIMCFFVTACSGGSYAIGIGHLDSTSHSITGSYNSFSGHYYREVKFHQGDMVKFSLVSHTAKGTLTANLIAPSGSVVATVKDGETVKISKTGTYKVQVKGDHHKGDFDLAWTTSSS